MKPEMLEIVLTELLEEQKKETITNAEIVSIIKRLFEKVEIIEQQVQGKDDPSVAERIRAIQIASQSISEKLAFPAKEITDLKRLLDIRTVETKVPVQSIIKHHHYFKTTAIIAFAFFIIIVVLTWLYLDKRKEANDHRASDIKYRYMNLRANANLSKVQQKKPGKLLYQNQMCFSLFLEAVIKFQQDPLARNRKSNSISA